MIIKQVSLTNYRNHKNLSLNLDSKINLIVGPNGAGKTNILEAIHLMSTTKAFRAKYDRDLIKHGEDFSKVEIKINSDENEDDYEMQIVKNPKFENTSSKKVKINSVRKSLNAFSTFLNTVLFSPEDIDLITGSPSVRRKYLNMLLFQVDRTYKKYSGDYLKAIMRRNKVLERIRETGKGQDEMPFWNGKILELGEYIQAKRDEAVTYLNEYFKKEETQDIKKGKSLNIEYNINEISTKKLLEYREKEIASGRSLLGPHRDDITFFMDGEHMSQFSSRGEQRTAIFLLKQGEYFFIENKTGSNPILLLDDIFSELDQDHREAVISFIKGQQTIITAAIEREFTDLFINKTITLSK